MLEPTDQDWARARGIASAFVIEECRIQGDRLLRVYESHLAEKFAAALAAQRERIFRMLEPSDGDDLYVGGVNVTQEFRSFVQAARELEAKP